MKTRRTKIIDCTIIFENPVALKRMVVGYDSIDALILDLQEEHPERNISRRSIANWKFMTVSEYRKLQEQEKGLPVMNKKGVIDMTKGENQLRMDLNSEQEDKRSGATMLNSKENDG